jgi:hypothetical protein
LLEIPVGGLLVAVIEELHGYEGSTACMLHIGAKPLIKLARADSSPVRFLRP